MSNRAINVTDIKEEILFLKEMHKRICRSKDGSIDIKDYINLRFLGDLSAKIDNLLRVLIEAEIDDCMLLEGLTKTIHHEEIERRKKYYKEVANGTI